MRAILMSMNKPHTDNIHSGSKKSELRKVPPKLQPPFKVYMYETKRDGGCGKVVSEWICKQMTEWPMHTGIPAHFSKDACVSNDYIRWYCDNGRKNLTEMHIDQTSVRVYAQPKPLSEFRLYNVRVQMEGGYAMPTHEFDRPPQNWCYVECLEEAGDI